MTFQEVRLRADRVRAIPLEAVLRLTGARPEELDPAKWHTDRGVLSVTGVKFINWNSGVGGGGAIDLAIHLHHLDFKAAVAWLWQHFPDLAPPEQYPPPPLPESFKMPAPSSPRLAAVKRYLVYERCISAALIQFLIEAGNLYADTRGNAVFLLRGKDNGVVGAERRGTSSIPWRGLAPGSRKDLGYFSITLPDASAVVLCESAIDAISCFALDPSRLCISTSGARPNPAWLPNLIRQGYAVFCGFDTDHTGDKMAQAMISLYPTIKRLRPSHHDWNDALRARS